MGVAMGEYHDVPRKQFDSMGAVLDFAKSPSLGEKVIDDDMFGSFAKKRRDFARRRRAEPPRRREFGLVEQRPFKFYRLEDFRESVHRALDSDSQLKFRDSRIRDRYSTASESSFPDARISIA